MAARPDCKATEPRSAAGVVVAADRTHASDRAHPLGRRTTRQNAAVGMPFEGQRIVRHPWHDEAELRDDDRSIPLQNTHSPFPRTRITVWTKRKIGSSWKSVPQGTGFRLSSLS